MGENELFPLEKRIEKNEECTMNIPKERLSEIAAIKESNIDYSDIPDPNWTIHFGLTRN
jgi:hypothetical protein